MLLSLGGMCVCVCASVLIHGNIYVFLEEYDGPSLF